MKCLYFGLTLTLVLMALPNLSVAMSADTDLLLIDESLLEGRVIPAISDFLERGDPESAKQLVRETIFSQQFQQALKSDLNDDRMAAQYFAKASEDLLEGLLPKRVLDDTGELIRDQKGIRKHQTDIVLSRFLVLFFCSWSRDGDHIRISLSRGRLTHYLRSQSSWMDEMLGSSNELIWNAPDIPLSIGGEAKLLTRAEATTLLSKLQEVPPPSENRELIKQYDALKQLLQVAAEEPRFRVLIHTA